MTVSNMFLGNNFVVTVTAKARIVTVSGPKGKITKNLTHQRVNITVVKRTTGKNKGNFVRVQMFNASAGQSATVSTLASLINNCCVGVTEVSNCRNKITSLLISSSKCWSV